MGSDGNHCSFVLLAEFDILEGAQLKYQFPQPLGVDEGMLAMSMLPDGAETQLDDWTIFFLNQTSFNTISPVLALDSPEIKSIPLSNGEVIEEGKPDLLCVLNLVRTKLDKTLDRGARVLALAICTRHPFIQIFKPVLLMALDDYLSDPSQDCLARLFDAVNSMDLSGAPKLSRYEKIIMRSSERKDLFAEKFTQNSQSTFLQPPPPPHKGHKPNNSTESYSSFEEGLMMRNREKERMMDENRAREVAVPETFRGRGRADTESSVAASYASQTAQGSPSEASFSLGGSAVWVGDESGLNLEVGDAASSALDGDGGSVLSSTTGTLVGTHRRRRSTDASSSSSNLHSKNVHIPHPTTNAFFDSHFRTGGNKDTHFYNTTVAYKDHLLPIKMPLSTFSEEVGDYSLITLIKVFSSHQLVSGPQHPHLHTSGPQTHPIIILFNALVTGKRIIFMGHKRPAGEVSTFVLSACALGSGCGAVLRGFIERAFPYANLKNRDEWEAVPAYIAGVTNPIFESSRAWDLLLDIPSGMVTVAKDIHINYPVAPLVGIGGPLMIRTGTLKAESSLGEDDMGRPIGKEGARGDFASKADNNADNLFIEDVKTAIEYHYGEGLVRLRFTEYVGRFVRLASRYEEEATGSTQFGYPSAPFIDGSATRSSQLGSGIVFTDDALGMKELASNAHRIEAWRKTSSYRYCCLDHAKCQTMNPIKGFDLMHQIFRLRHARKMSDSEVVAIMRALVDNVKTYDQVIHLLSFVVPHPHGLLHLGFGLFHQQEIVRDLTVELFNQLRVFPIGFTYLQAMNQFQRYAYVRLAHAKERYKTLKQQQLLHQAQPLPQPPQQQQLYPPTTALASRSHSASSVGYP